MRNMTSSLTINGSWIASPIPQIVPLRTPPALEERIHHKRSIDDLSNAAHELPTNRILRLELLVATAIIGFGCFVARTLTWENALRQATTDQSQSLTRLTADISRQDRKLSDLNQSLNRATRDLTAQMDALSRQLQAHQSEMTAIDSRLRRVERVLGAHQAE